MDEGLGLAAQRDRHAGRGAGRRDRLDPWIDAFVAPSVLRSVDVEVRLIVSPVPEPRLIVPVPMRIASS